MNTTIIQRLEAFRAAMRSAGIAAAIVPQADSHQGEYLAPHWQVRRWLSGFTGSAGDLVITLDKAALWTDSRYFLQAADQLEGTGIELMKDGLAETPSKDQYLLENLKEKDIVGIDGMLFTAGAVTALGEALAAKGIELNTGFSPIDTLWLDRPALPCAPVIIHDVKYAGETAAAKIERILADAAEKGAKSVFIAMLDEIAWTLNIRSTDVRHTPVATSYLYLNDNDSLLFIDSAKISAEVEQYLREQGVECRPYTSIKDFLASEAPTAPVLIDPAHLPYELNMILADRAVATDISAATRFKSVKNDTQLAGLRRAMTRDGVAMVRSLNEIKRRVAAGEITTELDVAEILRHYRRQGENYFDESFGTITGYGPHGAIVHYEADEDSNATLRPEGLLLIDSGAQYLDGTTDITRTICLGTPTEQEKTDFTLVMKGHIALARAVFPTGTRGTQLDCLAHRYLWQHGLNYLHGTGHGVGFFLSVHEGPHSIRMNNIEAPLLIGSVTSNEPGVYREGVHGIRCENLIECVPAMKTAFGDFLRFDTITLCPFDRALFDTSIMNADEIEWVNNYHKQVYDTLAPLLTAEEQKQLAEDTKPL